jgi:hypothetical protein
MVVIYPELFADILIKMFTYVVNILRQSLGGDVSARCGPPHLGTTVLYQ